MEDEDQQRSPDKQPANESISEQHEEGQEDASMAVERQQEDFVSVQAIESSDDGNQQDGARTSLKLAKLSAESCGIDHQEEKTENKEAETEEPNCIHPSMSAEKDKEEAKDATHVNAVNYTVLGSAPKM